MARKIPGVTGDGSKWYATSYDPVAKRKVRVKNPETGSMVFPSQQDAAEGKERFERAKKQPRNREYTVDGWVEEWTTNEGYARRQRSTNEHNAERVKKFGADFAGVPLSGIDRPMARKWAMDNRTRVMAVRTMLNDAVADGVLARNPFANLRLDQSRGRKDIVPLTREEVEMLVGTGYDLFEDWPVMGALITTAAYAGLRIGELSGLRWSDVDWEQGVIHVRRQWRTKQREEALPKSGKARTVAMLGPVSDALHQVPHLNTDDLVFYTRRDHARYTANLHAYFWAQTRTSFHAKLPPARQEVIPVTFDFHELRHFCGSWMADNGLTAQDIAFQLGHQDGGQLAQELYIHVYEDQALERIRKMGRAAANRPLRKAS